MLKERLQSLPKQRVIDENKMLAHIHKAMDNNGQEDEDEQFTEYQDSQYFSDNQDDYPDDLTMKSGSNQVASKINLMQSNLFNKLQDKVGLITAANLSELERQQKSIAGSTYTGDQQETETNANTLARSKNNQSRKSLKSVAVNEETTRKHVMTVNQNELYQLPNKSFYNSDGSKIQILGALN